MNNVDFIYAIIAYCYKYKQYQNYTNKYDK